MKTITKNLPKIVLILTIFSFVVYATIRVGYVNELGVLVSATDMQVKPVKGWTVYKPTEKIVKYPSTVQKIGYSTTIKTKDSILSINTELDYKINNPVDLFKSTFVNIKILPGFLRWRIITKTKSEIEDELRVYLFLACNNVAREYRSDSLTGFEFDKKVKEKFKRMCLIKGITVTSLKISIDPSFKKLLKEKKEAELEQKNAEKLLKKAELERKNTLLKQ